jgi:predicted secreted Zn-dependent protease
VDSGGQAVGLVEFRNATVKYYDVVGSTSAELRQQLATLGPKDSQGKRWHAVTSWRLNWRWPTFSDGTCRMGDATVMATVEVTFPRWAPPAGVARALIDDWIEYTRVLARHEQGHVDLAVDGAKEMQVALRRATCATADNVARTEMARINDLQEEYDVETDHGANQGAEFP